MSMVRIVRADGRPLAHYMRNPRPCKEVCKLIRGGHFPRNGFYRAEFVEPAPLFDVVTYHIDEVTEHSIDNPLIIASQLSLAHALKTAANERYCDARDDWAGWRTVVRAAR